MDINPQVRKLEALLKQATNMVDAGGQKSPLQRLKLYDAAKAYVVGFGEPFPGYDAKFEDKELPLVKGDVVEFTAYGVKVTGTVEGVGQCEGTVRVHVDGKSPAVWLDPPAVACTRVGEVAS